MALELSFKLYSICISLKVRIFKVKLKERNKNRDYYVVPVSAISLTAPVLHNEMTFGQSIVPS